jgi:carbamoyltransferase
MQKNIEKNPIIISIHFGHNATVGLLQGDEITDCVSEERFNRVKNSTGFPTLALEYILKKAGGKNRIDYFVFTQKYPWGYLNLKANNFTSLPYSSNTQSAPREPLSLKLFPQNFYSRVKKDMLDSLKNIEQDKNLNSEMENYFSNLLGVSKEKVLYLDHHKSHALSTLFFDSKNLESKKLIFTLDGEGDGLCATVSIFDPNKKDLEILSTTNKAFSIGILYREVTALLGMKPDEHEFKVMGLAPYAKQEHIKKILPIFEKILWLNKEDNFDSDIPMPVIKYYLHKNLSYKRFDNIAGAIQLFTENIVIDWIKRWIQKTNIGDINISGGVFMNVKMNQKIAELNEVSSLTITPSGGDESTVIGGCYYGLQKFYEKNREANKLKEVSIRKLENLYLGTEFSDIEIDTFFKENNYFKKYNISKPENISKKIAELLSENKVVARFNGRMEFGARALGNRSILANPSSYENIRIINEMIKNRDFWMPFATSIIEEDDVRYIKNPKKIDGSFMATTFDTTKEAYKDLVGAIHPYDKTSKPQIVRKSQNPEYHEIISEYKKITGSGGILNTSFNLHGEPNVESLQDAVHTLKDSGLEYLALGNFLISKKV